MRRIAGALVLLLALVLLAAGAAAAVIIGPDNRVTAGPHAVNTDGVAVVTKPTALSWAGPTLSVLAEVPDDKPVFVGLGSSVDVENYLDKTARLQVDSIEVPWKLSTSSVPGRKNLSASPTALDWWLTDAAGLGGATTTFRLPDQSVSLVVLSVGDSDLQGLRVTAAYDVRGGFGIGIGIGIGIAVVGAGLVLLSLPLLRARPLLRPLGRVEQELGRDDAADDVTSRPVSPQGPVASAPLPARVPTHASTAPPATELAPAAAPVAGKRIATEVTEEVVYVYIDEHGVEHEIDPADAHEYEVVEEGADEPVDTATAGLRGRRGRR